MLWLKAFHLVFMVCWFAGVFYLPRLFVYHTMSESPDVHRQLAIMERKLYRFVSMFAVLTVVLGLSLTALNPAYYLSSAWFQTKLLLVACLIIYHFYCGRIVHRLASGSEHRTHVFFRWFNELPVLFLFGIVILVTVKPF